MKQQNESVKELKIGRDYINVHYNNDIVIDRLGVSENRGFHGNFFVYDLFCSNPNDWREATEEEVIEAFRKHLVRRYGKDWETMKIKRRHPSSNLSINIGFRNAKIFKYKDGWNVYNKNDLLYCDGIWVERLEEPKIHIKDAIKANTVIHCETEEDANRVLGIAHELGYKWCTGENYENNTEWGVYESKMCYDLFEGAYSTYDYFKNKNYTIIPSTQIADLRIKETDWTLAPEDIKEIKAGEKVDKRYALKRDVLTILSVESKLNPDKKISEYLEQFKLILEVL